MGWRISTAYSLNHPQHISGIKLFEPILAAGFFSFTLYFQAYFPGLLYVILVIITNQLPYHKTIHHSSAHFRSKDDFLYSILMMSIAKRFGFAKNQMFEYNFTTPKVHSTLHIRVYNRLFSHASGSFFEH